VGAATGPAPCSPSGEGDDLAGRAPTRQARERLEVNTVGRFDADRGDPAGHSATVELDADPRPDTDLRPPFVRNGVVELAVDRGQVRKDRRG